MYRGERETLRIKPRAIPMSPGYFWMLFLNKYAEMRHIVIAGNNHHQASNNWSIANDIAAGSH